MSLRVRRWRSQDREPLHLYQPLLALLGALAGGTWTVDQEQEETLFPVPKAPMCVHRYRWRLLQGGQEAGAIVGDLEESGLNMPWSTFQVRLVEATLLDGRVLRALHRRREVVLSADGFTDAALRAAAEAVNLQIRDKQA